MLPVHPASASAETTTATGGEKRPKLPRKLHPEFCTMAHALLRTYPRLEARN
jgi:hypothetical protein